MCYCNCQFERYPNGFNEGNICIKRKYDKCMLEDSDEEITIDNNFDDYEPEPDLD